MSPSRLLFTALIASTATAQIIRTTEASGVVPVLYPAETQGLPRYSFPVVNGPQINSIANELAGAVQSWFSTVTTGADYAAYVSDLPSDVASEIEAATNVADLLDLSTFPTSFWSTFPDSAKSYHSEVWEAQRSFVMAAATSLGGVVFTNNPLPTSNPNGPVYTSRGPQQSASAASSNSIVHTRGLGTFMLTGAVSVGLLAFLL